MAKTELAIPNSVGVGGAVACNLKAGTMTLYAPAGSGRCALQLAGDLDAVVDPDDEDFASVYTFDLSSEPKAYQIPMRSASFARIKRINGSGAETATLEGEATLADADIKCALRDVSSTKRHVLDILSASKTVSGGELVCGEDGVTADGTDNSVFTIAVYDASGTALGTIGTFTLNTAKTAHQTVAMALGAYLVLPRGSRVTAKRANNGNGATVGVGAYIRLM